MKKNTVYTILLIGVIAICSVLITNKLFPGFRLDLTGNNIYTLSQGTRNIVDKLNQNVTFKLFYGKTAALKGPEQIKYFNNYFSYVRELLAEYEKISGGKITLEVLDPRPFSPEEEEAARYGIRQIPISQDENFFFGLAVVSELGKSASIEFFEPERQEFVEYDISSRISEVTQRQRNTVGILSSLPVRGSNASPIMQQMMLQQGRQVEQPWYFTTLLEQQFDVISVAEDVNVIPAEVDFLLVIHPKNLSTTTLYAIDQFVMRGGRMVVMVDPFCMVDQPPGGPQNQQAFWTYEGSSSLNSLLEQWGVTMEEKMIAADVQQGIMTQLSSTPLATALELDERNANDEDIISAYLHNVRMLFPGVLTIDDETEAVVTPLLQTLDSGQRLEETSPFMLRRPNPDSILDSLQGDGEKLNLAVRITGQLRSNYPDGPPQRESETEDQETEENELPQHLSETRDPASIVVIADVDLISNQFGFEQALLGVTPYGDNTALVYNAIEALKGDIDLIAIRSRGQFQRPFEVVDQIESETDEATRAREEALRQQISDYRERLNELASSANEENMQLMQNTALKEREQIQNEIRQAQRELRDLNAGKREKIESLGMILRTVNIVAAPLIVLIVAITLAVLRHRKRKAFAERRNQG